MSIGGKIRFLGFFIKDFINFEKEDRVVTQWKDIEETLSNYDTGWKKVEKSLHNCLDYATENCEFYKQYKGKPLREFPVLTKMDFIENFDKIKNPLFNDEDLHTSSTSGSTGTPFKVVQNRGKRNRVFAELKYFGEKAGYPSHEKMCLYRACHKLSFLSMFLSNVWQPDPSVLSEENLEKLYNYQKDSFAIYSYPSTLDLMVSLWSKKGYCGSDSVKLVMTSAELLTKENREKFRLFWKKANVISRYANMENGMLGQEEFQVENEFKCNWASYYFEVLKLDSDEPAEDGELGRLVITDMYNKAFPMIRYDNGDIVRMVKQDNDFPKFAEVQGRKLDMIYDVNGSPLSPFCITNHIWGLTSKVRQWQFVQETKTNYKFVFSGENTEEVIDSLNKKIEKIRSILGNDALIEIEYVDEIPVLKSNKRKMIVQKFFGRG